MEVRSDKKFGHSLFSQVLFSTLVVVVGLQNNHPVSVHPVRLRSAEDCSVHPNWVHYSSSQKTIPRNQSYFFLFLIFKQLNLTDLVKQLKF